MHHGTLNWPAGYTEGKETNLYIIVSPIRIYTGDIMVQLYTLRNPLITGRHEMATALLLDPINYVTGHR